MVAGFLNRGDRVIELPPGPDMFYLNCGERIGSQWQYTIVKMCLNTCSVHIDPTRSAKIVYWQWPEGLRTAKWSRFQTDLYGTLLSSTDFYLSRYMNTPQMHSNSASSKGKMCFEVFFWIWTVHLKHYHLRWISRHKAQPVRLVISENLKLW